MRKFKPVTTNQVQVQGGFWGERLGLNRCVTLPIEYQQCKMTGRIDAFKLDWKPGSPDPPHIFWDSDVAKCIEAACYSITTHPDARLEKKIEYVVKLISEAQQEDGYLNVHFTVVEPEKRWSNLRDQHELYCAGHLMEAAVAHLEATGRREFLDVMCRYADYIVSVFGKGRKQKRGYPGHEEIELALLKLYRATDRIWISRNSLLMNVGDLLTTSTGKPGKGEKTQSVSAATITSRRIFPCGNRRAPRAMPYGPVIFTLVWRMLQPKRGTGSCWWPVAGCGRISPKSECTFTGVSVPAGSGNASPLITTFRMRKLTRRPARQLHSSSLPTGWFRWTRTDNTRMLWSAHFTIVFPRVSHWTAHVSSTTITLRPFLARTGSQVRNRLFDRSGSGVRAVHPILPEYSLRWEVMSTPKPPDLFSYTYSSIAGLRYSWPVSK